MTHSLFRLIVLFLVIVPVPTWADPTTPRLPAELIVDYQVGGAYDPPEGVTVVVRHHTAQPAPGVFNICYFNGYQIPSGAAWPADLLVRGPDGKPIADPHWPHDYLLDISTGKSRARNFLLVIPMLQSCISKGFKAIEYDHLDSYSYSKGRLTLHDSAIYAKLLVSVAHGNGLAAGQKNTPELGRYGRDKVGFDFAIVEDCFLWDSCASFAKVYGDKVIAIEYFDNLRGSLAEACADPTRPRSLIVRDRMLVPAGQPDYVYHRC